MLRFVTTVGYVGLLKPGPGTWGSLAALPLAWGLHELGGPVALAAGIVALGVLGWWAVGRIGGGDPPEVVIDEVVGQWIALLPVSYGAWFAGAQVLALWPGIVTAFLAFRLYDIWKPGPVGWADRRGGASGVMLDDVIAGLMALGTVVILGALAHLPVILG